MEDYPQFKKEMKRVFHAAYNASGCGPQSIIGLIGENSSLFEQDLLADKAIRYCFEELFSVSRLVFSRYKQLYLSKDASFLSSELGIAPEMINFMPGSITDNVLYEAMWKHQVYVVNDTYKRFIQLFRIVNFKPSDAGLKFMISHIFMLQLANKLTSYIKYKTTWYVNYMQESAPEHFPKVNYLFDKLPFGFRKFHSKILSWKNRKPTLINTLFQGFKRGLVPVSPLTVFDTAIDHIRSLREEPEEPSEGFVDDLQEKVFEIMEHSMDQSLANRLLSLGRVSNNASYLCSRGKGGVTWETISTLIDSGDLCITAFFSLTVTYEKTKSSFTMTTTTSLPDDILEHAWRSYFNRTVPERCYALPHFILEPLKVRTITKGDSTSNAFLSPFQEFLYNILHKTVLRDMYHIPRPQLKYSFTGFSKPVQEFEMFELNTQPFILTKENSCEEVISHTWDLYWNSTTKGPWVSVDYSRATDLLKRHVSLGIFDMIERFVRVCYPSQYSRYIFDQARKSLYGYKLTTGSRNLPLDPSLELDEVDRCLLPQWSVDWQQLNGQLMGSIVSFPILCIANLICYWVSIENRLRCKYTLECLLRDFPVLVNGDDMLFKSIDEQHVKDFEVVCKQFGFQPSPGKNFVSHEFFMINSKLFRLTNGEPEYIPFVNFGLLTGRKKGSNNMEDSYESTETANRLLNGKTCYDLLIKDLRHESLRRRVKEIYVEEFVSHLPSYLEHKLSLPLEEIANDFLCRNYDLRRNVYDNSDTLREKTLYTQVVGSSTSRGSTRSRFFIKSVTVKLQRNKCRLGKRGNFSCGHHLSDGEPCPDLIGSGKYRPVIKSEDNLREKSDKVIVSPNPDFGKSANILPSFNVEEYVMGLADPFRSTKPVIYPSPEFSFGNGSRVPSQTVSCEPVNLYSCFFTTDGPNGISGVEFQDMDSHPSIQTFTEGCRVGSSSQDQGVVSSEIFPVQEDLGALIQEELSLRCRDLQADSLEFLSDEEEGPDDGEYLLDDEEFDSFENDTDFFY